MLRFGLDVFADDLEAEAMGNANDARDQVDGLLVMGQLIDEAIVDHECVDGQSLEIIQGGMAGADVDLRP